MTARNLWGFSPSEAPVYTPVQILREQAEQFNTGWKSSSLYAEVVQGDRPSELEYSLRVVAPVLNNYTLTVMTIRYAILGYPVTVFSDFGGINWREQVDIEDEYLGVIGRVLSDPKLGQAVNSLAAHSSSN